jgi:hypothetical protein
MENYLIKLNKKKKAMTDKIIKLNELVKHNHKTEIFKENEKKMLLIATKSLHS